MSKKILIATGGTGGHIYPAIALAQQLIKDCPDNRILFVGGGLSDNRYFDSNAFDSSTVSCGAFTRKSPISLVTACVNIGQGIWQSRTIIREFKPDVAVGFGSFYSFPPLIAAKLHSIPIVLHEANSIPGKVNRLLAPWAAAVGVHFPTTTDLLKGNCVEVGMPLRHGFQRGATSQAEAISHFGLSPDFPTLLIFGGSQGAQAINSRVFGALKLLSDRVPIQVIHIAGDAPSAESLQKIYKEAGIIASVKPYETRMDLAWQAADLAVCRAGAGTIAEQFEFEVPAILVPYPRAADNHQEYNADFIVKTVGAGKMIKEDAFNERFLAYHLLELFSENGAALIRMRAAITDYKKRVRTQDLCSLIKKVIL
ncbi:MAG: undecaprenyldiphospho-muramoylpentapeptide beta-N-acetylglucosaminyltransferase [Parachlamydiaceae bacterium]